MIYTLNNILPQSAQKAPNKTAFDSESESVTFAEADQKTNQLAQFLLRNGLKKSDRVGVFISRSVKSALAVHGILKAGGVFVPIDSDAPPERIQFMLDDCKISHIISETALAHKLETVLQSVSDSITVLGFNSSVSSHHFFKWECLNDYQSHLPEVKVLSSDLAYIMYTSGTTGYPKGIMHTHYSGLSYAKLSQSTYNISESDVVANHSPLHFDMCTLGYFTAPLAGATCIILGKSYSVFPASLSQLIEQKQVTVWYSVPLVLQQLLERGELPKRDFTSLRWVLFGGEPFPVHQLNQFIEYCPNAWFSNVYGPAEVNQCTFYHLKEKIKKYRSVPIGYVWNDTDHLIIDDNQAEVNQGEAGELLIHSSTMMAGYWNNSEYTYQSMVEVEIVSGYSKKFYKTGDFVKKDADGLLHFIGRKDRQIKTKGHRVELNEIEEIILRCKETKQVACYSHSVDGINEIFATVVLQTGAVLEELEKKIQKTLPKYSLPTLLIEADKLPRTSAGKVDYKKLSKNIRSIYDSKN